MAHSMPPPPPPIGSSTHRSRVLLLLIPVVALVLAGTACPRTVPGTSVLLLTVDSLRVDHLHALGYARETSPVLDGLAGEGTTWTGVVAPAPWTMPSMMSVMTGLHPEVHHVDEDDRMLGDGVVTLAQRFRKTGYATAAFVPEITLSAAYGFSRGFDHFDERRFGHDTVTSPAQASALIHWLESTPGPFFAWAHLWDPHYNYAPPPPYDAMFVAGAPPPGRKSYDMIDLKRRKNAMAPEQIASAMGQYDGEIACTDRYIGEILDALRAAGRLDSTLVVIAGDHGEAFQEHGWLTHTNTVYEETVRVPVIARLPGRVPAGRRIGGARSLVDLTESLAQWAGLRPAATQSRPLPLEEGAAEDLVVSSTRRQAALLSARQGRWSLVLEYETCASELYDLETDPFQSHDVASAHPEVVSGLKDSLGAWLDAARQKYAIPVTHLDLTGSDALERLKGLGYVQQGGEGHDNFGDLQGKRVTADPRHCL